MSQPTHRLYPASIYITPWFFSTIANIANNALVSTYISQVTGNHQTSTGLSMAKHIFDPGPTQSVRLNGLNGRLNSQQTVNGGKLFYLWGKRKLND